MRLLQGDLASTRPWIVVMFFSHMASPACAFAPMPVSPLGIRSLRHSPLTARRPASPILRQNARLPARQLAAARGVLRGVRRAARIAVSMAAVYCAELTFRALDVQQEFFVAKTLGSIALPGRVFQCTTDSEGKDPMSHFKFDFELDGSISDARGFLDEKFPGARDRGDAQPGDAVAPPEMITVNPALFLYCAELTFKALSDQKEVQIASALQSFALPNRTYVSFNEAPEAEGRSASFQFQFELGGTLDDAHAFVSDKFPSAMDREVMFMDSRIATTLNPEEEVVIAEGRGDGQEQERVEAILLFEKCLSISEKAGEDTAQVPEQDARARETERPVRGRNGAGAAQEEDEKQAHEAEAGEQQDAGAPTQQAESTWEQERAREREALVSRKAGATGALEVAGEGKEVQARKVKDETAHDGMEGGQVGVLGYWKWWIAAAGVYSFVCILEYLHALLE